MKSIQNLIQILLHYNLGGFSFRLPNGTAVQIKRAEAGLLLEAAPCCSEHCDKLTIPTNFPARYTENENAVCSQNRLSPHARSGAVPEHVFVFHKSDTRPQNKTQACCTALVRGAGSSQ